MSVCCPVAVFSWTWCVCRGACSLHSLSTHGLAQGIYSAANIVPTGLMRTGVEDCGELVLSFETIRSARATWFLGKFSLACFEVFILAASVWVLGHGSRISLRAEATQHAACLLGGLAAFLGFYFRCLEINNSG